MGMENTRYIMNLIDKIRCYTKALFLSETELAMREVRRLSERDLIIANHTLNRWEFPDKLKYIKPEWWDADMGQDMKFAYSIPIMDFIKNKVDAIKISHYHVVEHLGYDEAYFSEYWETSVHNVNRTRKSPIEDLARRVLFHAFKEKNVVSAQDIRNTYADVKLREVYRQN